MEARVTGYSQSERLRESMERAAVRHGQEIRADLPGIRVVASPRNWFKPRTERWGEVFFCTMGPVRVRETATPGDEDPLPTRVIMEGLTVPDSGTYDVLNALVQSNGDLRVIVDEATRVVMAAESLRHSRAAAVGDLGMGASL
jgi:hypothetical protein